VAKKFRKKKVEVHYYQCSITGERFKVNREAPNPDELVSVNAFYELNSEQDDRPEKIKKIVSQQTPVIYEDDLDEQEELE
jgi:hypothetical protein